MVREQIIFLLLFEKPRSTACNESLSFPYFLFRVRGIFAFKYVLSHALAWHSFVRAQSLPGGSSEKVPRKRMLLLTRSWGISEAEALMNHQSTSPYVLPTSPWL